MMVDHIIICGPQLALDFAKHAVDCPCLHKGRVVGYWGFALSDSITTIATMDDDTAKWYGLIEHPPWED